MTCGWPQSSERIVGRDDFVALFVALDEHRPARGRWRFDLNRCVAEGLEVVSDVSVMGGVVQARALTFSTVENGLIVRETQVWPETYPAPAWRRARGETE